MKLFSFLFLAIGLTVSAGAYSLPRTAVGPISARVNDASGELAISGDHWSTSLLVTAKIDSHVYSNNTVPKGVTPFAAPVLGQLRDTIVVRWTTDENVDVYLRCFPYDREIMLEVFFDNRSTTSHTCAVETLQSYGVEGVTAPYLGTDRDYSNLAREVPPLGSSGAPTLFLMGQANASVDPFSAGYIAGGRFAGSGLDLRGPAHLYFGVWYALASTAFGPPSALPVGCDGGLLLLWNSIGVPAHSADTISRWTLTNTVNVCSSSDVVLFSMSSAQKPFQAHDFNVASIAYSVNQRGLENPRIVMSVSDQLSILSTHDGTSAADTFTLASNLTRGQCEVAEWNVLSFDAATSQDISFKALGSNLTPLYRNGCGFAFQAPSSSIVFDGRNPYVVNESSSGASPSKPCSATHYSIDVEDTGSGIDRATITGNNFKVTPEPFIPGTDSVRFSVDVIDPFKDGSATVTFFDRSSHSTTRTYTYCSVEDTSPPLIQVHGSSDSALIVILENRPADRGVNFFSPSSHVNAKLDSSTLYQSIDSLSFVVRRLDPFHDATFCLTATDRAGNTSQAACWTTVANDVRISPTEAHLQITPNPARDNLKVVMDGVQISEISVLDLLGRSMLTAAPSLSGAQDIDISSLAAGFYLVRIVTGESVISRRIEIVR